MGQPSLKNVLTENIEEGIHQCYANGKSLVLDAEILINNKSYSRAYGLALIAIEELGKIWILFRLWIEREIGDEIDYNFFDNFIL